jgi:hypothetical protein
MSWKYNPFTGRLDIAEQGAIPPQQGVIPLTSDPVVLQDVTDENNWDDITGYFTGSTADLAEGGIYYDVTTNIKYEFDGNLLIRYRFNNIF